MITEKLYVHIVKVLTIYHIDALTNQAKLDYATNVNQCPENDSCLHCGHQAHKCLETTINLQLEEGGPVFYKGKPYDGIVAFRGENDVFSNLYDVPEQVEYDGKLYPLVEHAY